MRGKRIKGIKSRAIVFFSTPVFLGLVRTPPNERIKELVLFSGHFVVFKDRFDAVLTQP